MFPNLPASVPLTYTLTMKACLSERPEERPRFKQVSTLLSDAALEVANGEYVNSDGAATVRYLPSACNSIIAESGAGGGALQTHLAPHIRMHVDVGAAHASMPR